MKEGTLEHAIYTAARQGARDGVAQALEEQGGAQQLLVTVAEAADMLGVSKHTVYDELVDTGLVEVVEGLGRGMKITVASLQTHVADVATAKATMRAVAS